jgi:hypothetical protein
MTLRIPLTRALAAVALATAAGVHGGLVPQHLSEMPNTGRLFIVAAVAGVVTACWLLVRPESRLAGHAATLVLLTSIVAWALWATLPIPFNTPGTPEGIEPIALACKGVEVVGLLLLRWQSVAPAVARFFAPDHGSRTTSMTSADGVLTARWAAPSRRSV